MLFAESYQPGYPGEFLLGRIPPNILRTTVSWPAQFHKAWEELLAHVADFKPELILVSAGFDAHLFDPLGVIGLSDDDFTKLFRAILNVSPNVVACLEGGYELDATTRNAVRFVRELVAAA